jgi:hypothetical protein
VLFFVSGVLYHDILELYSRNRPERGVIYVHSNDVDSELGGTTLLRICGVKVPIPEPNGLDMLLDITLKFQHLAPHTFNWS